MRDRDADRRMPDVLRSASNVRHPAVLPPLLAAADDERGHVDLGWPVVRERGDIGQQAIQHAFGAGVAVRAQQLDEPAVGEVFPGAHRLRGFRDPVAHDEQHVTPIDRDGLLLVVGIHEEPGGRIFALLGLPAMRQHAGFAPWMEQHNAMLAAYRKQDWDRVLALLPVCREHAKAVKPGGVDGFYDLYDERIIEFRENPPPPDWDGVYVATSK